MRTPRRPTLAGFLTLAMSVGLSVSGVAAFEAPDVPPAENLARGDFQTAVFSRNAQLLLTSGYRAARLWNVETGALIRQFKGHDATIHSIMFSPDETRVLSGAGNAGLFGPQDATVRIWDIATGKQLAVLGVGDEHQSYVSSAQFSPDGKRVFSVSVDLTLSRGNLVVSWDIASKEKQFILSNISVYADATKWFDPIRISPGGNMLAGLTAESRQVTVWNARTGEVHWQIQGESIGPGPQGRNSFGSLQFSPDGMLLIGACSNDTARTWSTSAGHELQVFEGHQDRLCTATFSHAGKRVMTASRDGTARLWETDSGRQIKQYDHPGPIREMAISSDSKRMTTRWSIPGKDSETDRQWFTSLWDTQSGREIKRLDMPPRRMTQMVFSPDGQRVLVSRQNSILLLDAATGKIVRHYR